MRMISNEVLVDSYFKAMDLQLEVEFVELLLEEIKRRQLNVEILRRNAQVS